MPSKLTSFQYNKVWILAEKWWIIIYALICFSFPAKTKCRFFARFIGAFVRREMKAGASWLKENEEDISRSDLKRMRTYYSLVIILAESGIWGGGDLSHSHTLSLKAKKADKSWRQRVTFKERGNLLVVLHSRSFARLLPDKLPAFFFAPSLFFPPFSDHCFVSSRCTRHSI